VRISKYNAAARSGSDRPEPSVCTIEDRVLVEMVSIARSASGEVAKATVGLHNQQRGYPWQSGPH
jgi:hypothetical protein